MEKMKSLTVKSSINSYFDSNFDDANAGTLVAAIGSDKKRKLDQISHLDTKVHVLDKQLQAEKLKSKRNAARHEIQIKEMAETNSKIQTTLGLLSVEEKALRSRLCDTELDLKCTTERYEAEIAKLREQQKSQHVLELSQSMLEQEVADSEMQLKKKYKEKHKAVKNQLVHAKNRHQTELETVNELWQKKYEIMQAKFQCLRDEHETMKNTMKDAKENIESSKDIRALRMENNAHVEKEKRYVKLIEKYKKMEERKIVQEEIIRDLKLKLEKQVANGSNKTENFESSKDQLAWNALFKAFETKNQDILILAEESKAKACLLLLSEMRRERALSTENMGKLETRVKIMEKKLRDATARVLEETKRASELDVQLSDTQHKFDLCESKRVYLDKKVETLTSFMETYDKEIATNAGPGDLSSSRIAQLEATLSSSKQRIEDLQAQHSTLASPACVSKYKSILNNVELELKQSREECLQLSEALSKAESEMALMENRLGRGEFNVKNTKIVRLSTHPMMSHDQKEELMALRRENKELKDGHAQIATTSNISNTEECQGGDFKIRYERLLENFKKQTMLYQDCVRELTGYSIRFADGSGRMLRLQSTYAELAQDDLQFNLNNDDELELIETAFCRRMDKKLFAYLNMCHSIPAFLSSLTLHLFEQQSFQG